MMLSKEICTMLGAVGGDGIDLKKIYNEIGELIGVNSPITQLNLKDYFGLRFSEMSDLKMIVETLQFEIIGSSKNLNNYVFDTYGNIGLLKYDHENGGVVLVDLLHPED